jgi:hypothetical protein
MQLRAPRIFTRSIESLGSLQGEFPVPSWTFLPHTGYRHGMNNAHNGDK